MKRIGLISSILLGLSIAVSLAQTNNVLVIIADDLGVDYLGLYGLGNDPAPTPVLDSLADNGVLFTNAWTNPICSPSRANMLTGKYGFRTGIGTAITGLQNTSLDTSEYTIGKAVRDQVNVSTAMVGKWHLGHSSQAFRLNPNRCGFDYYAGNIEGQLSNYSVWQKTVNGSNSNIFEYATTVAVNDAINWVDNQTSDWMLFLSFNAPHEPFHRPPNNLHSFDGITTNPVLIAQNPIPHFKAMVEAMDTEIGRLLNHLSSTGELAATDIIFIGDNGSPPEVEQSPFSANKMKGTMYNGGVQVPMIVSGPSVVNSGREAEELVNSTDLYHTILELLGGDVSTLPMQSATDSRSFLPVITNSSDSGNQRAWIYGDLFKPTPTNKDGKAITDGVYKLIEFDNGTTEFYNLSTDFFENNPLNTNSLSTIAQDHYNFLCSELSNLVNISFCQTPTSLFDQQLDEIGIYPNPVGSELNLTFNTAQNPSGNKYIGRIYNSTGSLVQSFQWAVNPLFKLQVAGLPSGNYHLVISDNGIPIGAASFVKQPELSVK